ncbi:transposase family Tnp2 domain-containing protein [Phanerochaete sordida]|uniref:Transposase family Tnp2 domain-containing protein n=1 Tax=Phanerochaete sordida TaxID=48140 RepID=A0A9P3GTK0_9APHY|nr:transposase family Tnp2 domain-containing protein [Phanerochaete sordida]
MASDDGTKVRCACCGKLVSRSTEWRHTKSLQEPSAPLLKATALTYRNQIRALANGQPYIHNEDLPLLPLPPTGDHILAEPLHAPEEANGADVHAFEHGAEPAAQGTDSDGEAEDVGDALRRMYALRGRPATVEDDDEDEDEDPLGGDGEEGARREEPAEEMDMIDEDGLAEYERLGERFEQELADIAHELSPQDLQILRSFAYRVRNNVSDGDFETLPLVFDAIPDNSAAQVDSRAAFLSGFDPRLYHCCPKSCMCYVGPYADLQQCLYCGTSRYNGQGRPRKTFTYIPLIPRLRAMYRDPQMAKKLEYRSHFAQSPPKHRVPGPECERLRKVSGRGVAGRCYCPSKVEDVFDGHHYRALCDSPVIINDKPQPHAHFSHNHDLALGLSTDGFAPFKRRSQTCWPLIVYNYNLPPQERFKKDNILCLGVVPGPHKPQDIDSFLWVLAEEMLQLAHGTPTYHALDKSLFRLHAHLILAAGDIPALSMVLRMKGHNGRCPCRMCKIRGVQIPDGTNYTHYVPLDRSRHPSTAANPALRARYDPLDLPLRTHDEFLAQAREVERAATNAAANELAKECGIKGVPVLSCLSSLSFPLSFPYDFMHELWENVMPNLVSLWVGDYKGLDEGREPYELHRDGWANIGKATAAASNTIPSAFGPRLGDISDPAQRKQYTADMWSFWTLHLAPALLKGKFRHQKYYDHFLELVRLLNICLQFGNTADEISQLRSGFSDWVRKFETYYYQYNPERLSTCVLTLHALLHVADSIELSGPVWTYWAFPMERYCGLLQRHIKNRRFPYSSIDVYVTKSARLAQLGLLYHITDLLALKRPRSYTVRGQYSLPISYPDVVFLPPRLPRGAVVDAQLLRRIAVHLNTRFGCGLVHARRFANSDAVELYGKLRQTDEGDTISADAMIPATEDRREATWVRYEVYVDRNARRRHAREEYERVTHYGLLEHLVVLHLPDHPAFMDSTSSDPQPRTLMLADIHSCNDFDGPPGFRLYQKMGTWQVFDVSCVQCVVGRAKLPTVGCATWAIIDRSPQPGEPDRQD